MRVVFVVCVVLFVALANAQLAPCVFEEGEFYSYTKVLNCFHSILLTDDVKYTTLETLKRSIEVYAFYDIAHDSPDPNLPVHVNMQEGLETIAKRPYVYDFDFHSDLRYLYNQLNDAHTQYYAPTCYQNILIRQGFAPIGFGNTTENFEIRISPYFPDDLDAYYEELNITLGSYVDYTISTINGVPAYDYFMNYANSSIGMSKDVGTRFNYALTVPEPRDDMPIIQYGYWQQRTHRNPFPETSVIEYGLVSPSGEQVTVILPWTFKALKTYDGQESWLEDYFAPSVEKSYIEANEKWNRANNIGNIHVPVQKHFMPITNPKHIEEHKKQLVKEQFGDEGANLSFELLVGDRDLSFWQLSDNETFVMYLDTMEPGRFSGFTPTLLQGFEMAAERGLSRFIIDLTNNGGGNICLGRALLAFLQKDGWAGKGQNWGPQDLPLSPLAELMIQSAVENDVTNTIWSPAFYDNQQDEQIDNDDTSYLLPGLPHVRGGLLRNYSKLLHINGCGGWGYDLTPAVDFNPKETILITKGLCGSTCALFANHMNLYDDVRTVVLGGMPGREQMQYTSFPGLQVLDKKPLFGQFINLKQNVSWVPLADIDPDNVVPRLLPTSSDFRYCVREIYPPEASYSTVPMEYNFQPADYHLYNNKLTASYPQYVWYEVADLFLN